MNITVRYALREELPAVNVLCKMVYDLHAAGRPDMFRPDFGAEAQARLAAQFDSEEADVIVALADGIICGYTVAEYVRRPEGAVNTARSFYHIDEFGVAPAYRRKGAASAMVDFCRREAAEKGFARLELSVWEFNAEALAFYEAAGFTTYRRLLELPAEEDGSGSAQ